MVTRVDDLVLEKMEVKLVHIMVSGHLFLGIHLSRSKFDIPINTMTSFFIFYYSAIYYMEHVGRPWWLLSQLHTCDRIQHEGKKERERKKRNKEGGRGRLTKQQVDMKKKSSD